MKPCAVIKALAIAISKVLAAFGAPLERRRQAAGIDRYIARELMVTISIDKQRSSALSALHER